MSQDSAFLDERDERAELARKQAARDRDALAWLHRDNPPEVRIVAFDVWCRRELAARLVWDWAGAQKPKRIEQARLYLRKIVLGLWNRGWELDGKRLADRLTDVLDAVGKAQRAGKVGSFWPYFSASVDRFVGQNAEELREDAMQMGAHVGQVFQTLVAGLPATPSLPALIAQQETERLNDKAKRVTRQKARQAAEKSQLPLL
ncbi:MAG: hypothetical protein C0518_05365 [Opitutus sp.]|nr:hypothetical protein [Opitutus sp.]